MSEQHTPGPWLVGPVIDGGVDDIPEIVIQRATALGNLSVSVALGGLSGQEANARLIAAAPELLEALRQAAMWLPILTHMSGLDADATEVELSEFSDGRPPVTISIASSLEAARAAIAKAGGAA